MRAHLLPENHGSQTRPGWKSKSGRAPTKSRVCPHGAKGETGAFGRLSQGLAFSGWAAMSGPNKQLQILKIERTTVVKVIASGVRKGNVIEHEDGKLYVVLKAESMHPGKGTPTTTIDMRRISDGVKTVVRYKTTDTMERAFVETVMHTYLY